MYGTFCDALRHCGTFWDVVGHMGHFGTLKGHFGMFWNILGPPFSISGLDKHFSYNWISRMTNVPTHSHNESAPLCIHTVK